MPIYGDSTFADVGTLNQESPEGMAAQSVGIMFDGKNSDLDAVKLKGRTLKISSLGTQWAQGYYTEGPKESVVERVLGVQPGISQSGTVFMVDNQHVVTALHVLQMALFGNMEDAFNRAEWNENDLSKVKVAFGYVMKAVRGDPAQYFRDETKLSQINYEYSAGEDDLYSVQTIVAGSDQQDWVKVKLDRKIKGRSPLVAPRSRQGSLAAHRTLYMIGHPLGQPMKLSRGKLVDPSIGHHAFTATIDSYSCNSGSPVFDAKTDELLGVFTSGPDDFRLVGTKYCTLVHPTVGPVPPTCSVTKITEVG